MIRYSASRNAFYDPSLVYPDLPSDLVDVTPEAHAALLEDQRGGMSIGPGIGGAPTASIPVPAVLTVQERVAVLLFKVDAHLNAAAKEKGYDDIKSAALRAAYLGPYHAEGMAFATWMDSVYAECYRLLAEFESGALAEPTAEQLIPMLPALDLPS